jgi:hypothetical protein
MAQIITSLYIGTRKLSRQKAEAMHRCSQNTQIIGIQNKLMECDLHTAACIMDDAIIGDAEVTLGKMKL